MERPAKMSDGSDTKRIFGFGQAASSSNALMTGRRKDGCDTELQISGSRESFRNSNMVLSFANRRHAVIIMTQKSTGPRL